MQTTTTKIAKGHYSLNYKGFTIDITNVGTQWYATLETTDYELADKVDTKGDAKGEVIEVVKYKIDQHINRVEALEETAPGEWIYKGYVIQIGKHPFMKYNICDEQNSIGGCWTMPDAKRIINGHITSKI